MYSLDFLSISDSAYSSSSLGRFFLGLGCSASAASSPWPRVFLKPKKARNDFLPLPISYELCGSGQDLNPNRNPIRAQKRSTSKSIDASGRRQIYCIVNLNPNRNPIRAVDGTGGGVIAAHAHLQERSRSRDLGNSDLFGADGGVRRRTAIWIAWISTRFPELKLLELIRHLGIIYILQL
ncbi:hypothetical protein OPV22_008863 [Ensete ventricosum]|uniref:Uncharacterized protein n=1 Tax=Ensete ventricosum TaxID=4639 RepID=A0AAV8RH48_ENSVE|nr:hypothetical protein OPV22_008863 [Ensete ventricosum]